MSIIRDHVLAGGGMSFAHKAAAAAVFELAQDGYLKIRIPSSRLETIRLTRTAKSGGDLLPEQKILLEAIFGANCKAGDRAYLKSPAQIPIADSLAAYARALLVADGSIRKLRPRKVYRWLCFIFYGCLLTGTLVMVGIFQQVEALIIALVISGVAWAFFGGFTLQLKHTRVFRTAKSKNRYERLSTLRIHSRYNTYNSTAPITADELPYELLWLRHGQPRSVSAGLYDRKPAWCDNDRWFATRKKITAALITAMESLARSLGGQESITQYIYLPTAERQVSEIELAEKKLDALIDVDDNLREVINLSNDLDDWGAGGGGDGSGGDGGDGSGGDGGGDGGDG